MSIAQMTHVVLCGMAEEKAEVIAGLQELGCLHLVPLREVGPLEPTGAAERRRADAAWRHLNDAAVKRRPWPKDRPFDLEAVVAEVLANKERLRELSDRRDFLVQRIAGLEPFGDFALPPLEERRGMRLWFYDLPQRHRRALEAIDLPWAIVGQAGTRLHLAVIARDEPPADLLPVKRTRTGPRRLSALSKELEEVEIEIERTEAERAELTRQRLALGLRLARAADADDRRAAAGMTLDRGPIFALAAWAPAACAADLIAFANARGLALRLEPPAPRDAPPTLLTEGGAFEGAADLTSFYMVPAYRSWDPSLIVFASFCLFFAMILADAGYAAVLLLGLGAFWGRISAGGAGRRLGVMMAAVFGAALVYGVLAGSYFGVAPSAGSLLGSFAVIDVGDFQTMMAVSVIIGVLHISLACCQVALRNPGTPIMGQKLGWVAVTWGGLLMWLAPSALAGALPWVLLIGGLVTVFLAAALARPAYTAVDWLWRLADGLLGLTGLTGLFGDVLSYMRLFALGLASGSLAATFNRIAAQMAEEVPGGGVALALLVLIFGHAVNLALGILSGVVHGLRLNFIEFFNWGLSEEGYPFKAFAHRETAT